MDPMAAPLTARVSVETLFVPQDDVSRFVLALIGTVGYFVLLFVSLLWRTESFQPVAAATSGIVGAIWGYYFGTREKK